MRLVAKTDDEATAKRLLDAEEAEVRAVLGEAIFGVDNQSMENVVLSRLKARAMTVSASESLTGGILAHRMTGADPDLTIFRGATIAPAPTSGSATERAIAAAEAARAQFATDVGLAVVEPAPSENAPKGTVYMAVVIGGTPHVDKMAFPGDHNRLREYSVISLLDVARRALDGAI